MLIALIFSSKFRAFIYLKPVTYLLIALLCIDLSSGIHPQETSLKECTISKVIFLRSFFKCREASKDNIIALSKYWKNEDDAELCHYFYFPLSDPSASKALLIVNYLIMNDEIKKRRIDCIRDHKNLLWYRGKDTKSMLSKLQSKYGPNL